MKILVFIKEVPETQVPLELHEYSGGLREDGLIFRLNPPDLAAMDLALRIKENFDSTKITLINLGRIDGERWLREGLALGCDDGLRLWDDGLEAIGPDAKSYIFARMAEILGFDLILTGNKSLDTSSCQTGILMACHLNLPHISSVTELELKWEERKVIALRRFSRGYLEKIQCSLPLVVTMETIRDFKRYASLPALLETSGREIPCWDLSQIGIAREQLRKFNAILSFGPLRFPKPKLKYIPAPEASLPAFERIRALLYGTVQRRGGKLIQEDEDEVVEVLFQTLLQEGWLDHLKGNPKFQAPNHKQI